MNGICYQINLQPGWGGGEIYTASLTRAMASLGTRTVLFAAEAATGHWRQQLPIGTKVVGVGDADTLASVAAAHLPVGKRGWLVFHTLPSAEQLAPLRAAGHLLTCFAHMPLYGRDPAPLLPYDLVIPVSRHVLASLHAAGVTRTHDEPLYGVADLSVRCGDRQLRRRSCYDWDRRKLRDRLFGAAEPLVERLRTHPPFTRGDGIALGIVSRLTPIKQFPLLFADLAPVLARHPDFRLEIFGSGGYASVRDLRRALTPIRDRVRFWGQQADVVAVYRQLDYLLTGLPEKEALGLNLIEAQACGLPVLAIEAPPFIETVAGDVSGLFYTDPRTDDGASFATLLARLATTPFKPDPIAAAPHLHRFSAAAFTERVARLVAATAGSTESGA
jgi:glycosyltransferase involved in cell wall biosynthesis